MSTLIGEIQGSLNPKKLQKRETTAIISSKVDTHQYMVSEAGRTILVRTAVTDTLKEGDHVVLAATDHGKFIVGLDTSKNRGLTTVIING